jgi:hypothetical protein
MSPAGPVWVANAFPNIAERFDFGEVCDDYQKEDNNENDTGTRCCDAHHDQKAEKFGGIFVELTNLL